jgi:ketosteroid isomerase-like protein
MQTRRFLPALLAGIAVMVLAQELPRLEPAALREMVETERAFAAMGAEVGVYDSFFKYFGEEGISFSRHPERFRERARKSPPPTPRPPRQFKLEWWPVYGDVAESGDLGYNTGPTLVSDLTAQNRPSRHGYFFSVWKKQADGTWNVAVDMGTDTPGVDAAHQDRMRYTRAPQKKSSKVKRAAAEGRAELMKLEDEFFEAARKQAGRDAYIAYMAEYCRLHRSWNFPILGREAAGKYFAGQNLSVTAWEAIDGGVSTSGELGYTYGRYEIRKTENGAERTEKGYFTRVWKQDGRGKWKLVADVTNALPNE